MPTESQGKKGKRNRNGLLTFTRVWVVDSEDECLTVGEASVLGCGEEDREWKRLISGVERWEVTINYAGIEIEDDSKAEITVKEVIREEPIESHPNIEAIKKAYSGVDNEDGTISFPLYYGGSTSSGSGLSASRSSQKNPAYGLKSYGRKSAEWTRTYVRRSMPSDLLDKAGKTTKTPIGAPPAPTGKVWVYGCSEAHQKGSAFTITEKATLEDENGPAKVVYATLV